MNEIRNVAIIAHVDHGKTTLVDKVIYASQTLDQRQEKQDLILDNTDLERERGITIMSKNIAVRYQGIKINIIDTPGHADFGGEVERVLKMADGVLLLVDAFEGPMPQTRFVLGKALDLGLKPIVVINKVDKKNCQPDVVQEKVFELMFELDADEDQLDFVTLFGSAKQGWMSDDWKKPTPDIKPLLDAIIDVIPPAPQVEGVPQMRITSLDYSSFVGKIAIGRLSQGEISPGKLYGLSRIGGSIDKVKIKEAFVFEGLERIKVDRVECGDICAITGLENFDLGDTITDLETPQPLPRIAIDEPTMSMLFTINNSPFFGKEGKYVTSRHLRDRLMKETEKNLALKVIPAESEDKFIVHGRGILHLSILIETMRREGYELQIGQPQVIYKEIDGRKGEPIEELVVDVPQNLSGKVIELATQRKATMLSMETQGINTHIVFDIPSRGLIGLRNQIITATSGEAVMYHRFKHYEAFRGDIPTRTNGSLISMDNGPCTAYALDKLQDRGVFFVGPGEILYAGQVIGEHSRSNDLVVNVQKGKKLTNIRAASADEGLKIAPKKTFTLEEAMEYINEDEYVEVTPKSIRLRKIDLATAKV